MKAILVFDVENENTNNLLANVEVYRVVRPDTTPFYQKLNGVELKPMPKYINSKEEYIEKFGNSAVNGYNACIDEILGEEE